MFNIYDGSEFLKVFNRFWGQRGLYGSFDQLITEHPISRILDLGANVAPEGASRILIRAEYPSVYCKLLDLYANAKTADRSVRPGGAVITGYSGGKECLLVFILVQRLLDRLDTAFSMSGEIFYFTNDGVDRLPSEYKVHFRPSADAWLLFASDPVSNQPPQQFLMRPRTNFLVNVGRIEETIQNSWSEGRLTFLGVMNPWSLEEIEFINEHLLERPVNPLALRQAYHHSGPSLRNCLVSCTCADLDERRIQRLKEATQYFARPLMDIVDKNAVDIVKKIGHGFLIPWRADTGDVVVGFPSYFVAGLFYRTPCWIDPNLSGIEWTIAHMRPFADIHSGALWLFEHMCHDSGYGYSSELRSLDAATFHTMEFEPALEPVSTWGEAVYSGRYFQLPQVQHDGNTVTALSILNQHVYLFAPTLSLAPHNISGTHLDDIRSDCMKAHPNSALDLKFHLVWVVPNDMESTFSRQRVDGGSVESQQILQYSRVMSLV